MEGICANCKTDDYLVAFTCQQCKYKSNLCTDCMTTFNCTHGVMEEKLKGEEELHAYMYFNPDEEAGILGSSITTEVLLVSKKNPKKSGFNNPSLQSTFPLERLPCLYSATCQFGPNFFIINGGLVAQSETEMYSLNYCLAIYGSLSMWDIYPMPTLKIRKHCHKLIMFKDQVYAIGGINKEYAAKELKYLSECEMLNIPNLIDNILEQSYPLTDDTDWSSVAPMTTKRAQCNGFAHGDYIYVYGGYSDSQVQVNSIERYHPASNKWELIKDIKLDESVKLHASLFLAETLCLRGNDPDAFYILGGTNGKKRFNTVYMYNAKENSIKEAARLKNERSGNHGFADGDTLYILGGDSATLSYEKLTIDGGKVTVEVIESEDQVESLCYESIPGMFLGTIKSESENK